MTTRPPPLDWRTGLKHLVSLIDATGGRNEIHLKRFDLYVTYLVPTLSPMEMVEFMEILGHDSQCLLRMDNQGQIEVTCSNGCSHHQRRIESLEHHLSERRRKLSSESVACSICGAQTRSTGTELCDRCWELKTRIGRDPGLAIKLIGMALDDMSPEEFSRFISTYLTDEIERFHPQYIILSLDQEENNAQGRSSPVN